MKFIVALLCLIFTVSCVSKEYTREENAARKLLRLLPRYKVKSGLCQRARRQNNYMIGQLIPDGTRRRARLLRLNWAPIRKQLQKLKRKAHCLPRREKAELFHMLGLAHEFTARTTTVINVRKCVVRKTTTHSSFTTRPFCKVNAGNMLSAASHMQDALRYYNVAVYLRKRTDSRLLVESEPISLARAWQNRFQSSVTCVKKTPSTCFKRQDQSGPFESVYQ